MNLLAVNSTPLFAGILAVRTLVEYMIYAGAIVLVSVVVTLWIASSRLPLKPSEHQHRHRSPFRGLRRWFGGGRKHDASGHKRRRRRREHRPRNPTLAETGGLPPIRSQIPSSSTDHYQD